MLWYIQAAFPWQVKNHHKYTECHLWLQTTKAAHIWLYTFKIQKQMLKQKWKIFHIIYVQPIINGWLDSMTLGLVSPLCCWCECDVVYVFEFWLWWPPPVLTIKCDEGGAFCKCDFDCCCGGKTGLCRGIWICCICGCGCWCCVCWWWPPCDVVTSWDVGGCCVVCILWCCMGDGELGVDWCELRLWLIGGDEEWWMPRRRVGEWCSRFLRWGWFCMCIWCIS